MIRAEIQEEIDGAKIKLNKIFEDFQMNTGLTIENVYFETARSMGYDYDPQITNIQITFGEK